MKIHAQHQRRAARKFHRDRLAPGAAGRHSPVGGRLPSWGAGCPSSSTSSGQTAAASGWASSASARVPMVAGCTSVSSCRKKTYSASAARQPRFRALVRPKFFGQADELHVRKIVAELRAAVGGAVIDGDHLQGGARRRKLRWIPGTGGTCAARFRDTTTTETRGGCFCCSEFS